MREQPKWDKSTRYTFYSKTKSQNIYYPM